MKPEEFPPHRADIAPFLPADFASRAISRARVVERHRIIRRRLAAASLPIAAALAAVLIAKPALFSGGSYPVRRSAPAKAQVSNQALASADNSVDWSDSNGADDRVSEVMFPDVQTVADFDSSYQSNSWNFYNPSWPSGSE